MSGTPEGTPRSGLSARETDRADGTCARKLCNRQAGGAAGGAIGGLDLIDKVIDIDQSPIGRTPRSNPAT